MLTLKKFMSVLIIFSIVCVGTNPAFCAPYPERPVRVVVPFAPGGSTDILIRPIAQKLSELMGQPFIIDNRGGAGGVIGAEIVAKAPPDGYTIMATTSGVIVANPSLYQKLSYNPIRDFAPITIMASLPNMLVVPPSVPAKSVIELIALAKEKPGQLTYASGGTGTSNHLAGELFKYLAKIQLTHVPYKGGGPAVTGVLTGEVSMLFATMPSAMPYVQSGRLRALAVTSRKRSPSIPKLPTMIEAGVEDFEVDTWGGLLAPHGVPAAIIDKLNGAVVKSIQAPDVVAMFKSQGYEAVGCTPAEAAAKVKTEIARWADVIKAAGIHAK